MRRGICWMFLAMIAVVPTVGCGPAKEDPTKREGFKDTSDPGNFGNLNMQAPEGLQKPETPPE